RRARAATRLLAADPGGAAAAARRAAPAAGTATSPATGSYVGAPDPGGAGPAAAATGRTAPASATGSYVGATDSSGASAAAGTRVVAGESDRTGHTAVTHFRRAVPSRRPAVARPRAGQRRWRPGFGGRPPCRLGTAWPADLGRAALVVGGAPFDRTGARPWSRRRDRPRCRGQPDHRWRNACADRRGGEPGVQLVRIDRTREFGSACRRSAVLARAGGFGEHAGPADGAASPSATAGPAAAAESKRNSCRHNGFG